MWLFKKKKNNKLNWEDINLSQFMEIEKILKTEEDEKTKEFKISRVLYGEVLGDLSFLRTPIPTKKANKTYKINGRKYKIQADITKLNTSQYIDYINGKCLLDWLIVLIIPQGHNYNDGYDLEEVKKDILNLPIIECKAISDFLKRQLILFIKITEDYLKNSRQNQLLKKNLTEEEERLYSESMEYLTMYIQFVENLI